MVIWDIATVDAKSTSIWQPVSLAVVTAVPVATSLETMAGWPLYPVMVPTGRSTFPVPRTCKLVKATTLDSGVLGVTVRQWMGVCGVHTQSHSTDDLDASWSQVQHGRGKNTNVLQL